VIDNLLDAKVLMAKDMKGSRFIGFFIRQETKLYLASVNHVKTY